MQEWSGRSKVNTTRLTSAWHLDSNGIDVLLTKDAIKKAGSMDELANISMAYNYHDGIHSAEYAHAVWKRLDDVVEAGKAKKKSKAAIKKGLVKELQKMRDLMQDGNSFWKST